MIADLGLELARAAQILVRDMIRVKPGEDVLIYADTESDWRTVEETAKAVHSVGGRVATMGYPAPRGVGEAADPDIPAPLGAAMSSCDVIIEFSSNYLLYSTPWRKAMETQRVRYLCLSGVTAEMMVRCVGRVDLSVLVDFQEKIADLTKRAGQMRITTPAGTNIQFENDASRPVFCEGIVTEKPGDYMLIGQVDWAPIEETINGVIAFDGSVWPPEELGIVANPVLLDVREGRVVEVKGGREARALEKWLDSFQDPAMYNVVHISYGCNPGAKLSGYIVEDERVWGCVEWGLGHQGESFKGKAGPARSHTDGICLNASIWMDENQISNEGSFIHPELSALAEKLGKK